MYNLTKSDFNVRNKTSAFSENSEYIFLREIESLIGTLYENSCSV